MPSGLRIGQHRSRARPSLQKVLLDSAGLERSRGFLVLLPLSLARPSFLVYLTTSQLVQVTAKALEPGRPLGALPRRNNVSLGE